MITGGKEPNEKTIALAETQGIPLLRCDLKTFEAAGKLYQLMPAGQTGK